MLSKVDLIGRRKSIAAFVFAVSLSLATSHSPTFAGDPSSVRGVIAEHCIECHRVPGFLDAPRSPEIGAPDFADIAQDRKIYTTKRLKAFLRQPHFPMRQFTLSDRDIDNILAFIFALRNPPEAD